MYLEMGFYINLMVMGSVSGGHFNPAVTIAHAIVGLINLEHSLIYIFA